MTHASRAAKPERPFQFTIREMLVLVGVLALVWGLAVYFEAPEVIPVTGIALVAWYLWRATRIGLVGLVLGFVAMELLAFSEAVSYRLVGVFDLIPCLLSLVAGFVCGLAGAIAFAVSAFRRENRRWHNGLACVAMLVAPLAWVVTVTPIVHHYRDARIARRVDRNMPTLQALVADVERVSAESGRTPVDEDELVALRREPMPRLPSVPWGDVRYERLGPRRFKLSFGGDYHVFTYDSAAPDRGWHRGY